MTMGERDFRQVIDNALKGVGRQLDLQVDLSDNKIFHIQEVMGCLRRSYYDRTDPIEKKQKNFHNYLSGLFRKSEFGSKTGEFDLDDLKLKAQGDLIIDDVVLIFRSVEEFPEIPFPSDMLYLNACLYIFDKFDGIIVYIAPDGTETSFGATKQKKMFEESIRRVRVLADLLAQKRTPILEPSTECTNCQYYERCYIKTKIGKLPINMGKMDFDGLFGLGKK
jgi:CRISPR-associated exonuclease Cas4|tara:strand:- start:75 stop:740 length:666 start_codon:yes stop_codon:yes gene_type:complete